MPTKQKLGKRKKQQDKVQNETESTISNVLNMII